MKNKIIMLLVVCVVLCSTGCKKTATMSKQLTKVFEDYHFSSTISTVNLDSSGYYSTQTPPKVIHQPSTAVVDYIGASKRIPEKAVINIAYADYNKEQDAQNVYEIEKEKIVSKTKESGTDFITDNLVIGIYVPEFGNNDNICLFFLLYKSNTAIVYINEQGPISYVEENKALIIDICKTVGFDPTETINELINDSKALF